MSLLSTLLDFFSPHDGPAVVGSRHHDHVSHAVWIHYTNHRGERAWRLIRPLGLAFGHTEFHAERQWFVHAIDVKRDVVRDFAMASVHSWHAATDTENPPKVILTPDGVTVEVK